jgi:hypothetical protein
MIDITIRLEKRGPRRYRACVDLDMDVLTGYADDVLGAIAEGSTSGEAIESASAKALAMIRGNPEFANVLIPLAGPQLAAILVAARSLDAPAIVKKFDAPTRRLIKMHAESLRSASAKVERRPMARTVLLVSKSAAKKYKKDVKREVKSALDKERAKLEKQIAKELGLEGLTVKDAKKLAKKKAKEYTDEIADDVLVEGAGAVGAYFGGPVGRKLARDAMEKYGKKYLKKYAKKIGKKAKKYAKKLIPGW